MNKLISTNPGKSYEVVGKIPMSEPGEIKRKVFAANKARKTWKELGAEKRIALLMPLINKIENRKAELALTTTREMGKPIKESMGDIEWDLGYLKSFIKLGMEYLKDEVTYSQGKSLHKIIYEPIGSVAVIVPWNFPFGNLLWGVIPNLIAGNTVVCKHSEETPLIGKIVEEMMSELHLPDGVFAEVYGDGTTGAQLVNQNIDFIWFTGSSSVGKKLFELAGKKFIKSTMELGGSNPAILCEDIDVKKTVERIFTKRFMNCGQVCDAVKRLIVHHKIFEEVVCELKKIIESKIIGNPESEKTDIGSLVSRTQLITLEEQVQDALKKGAKVIVGGKRPTNLRGAYFLPTILTNIKPNMKVWYEEVFGPVLPIVSFKTDEEAIKLANDTEYGLGAVVCASNVSRAEDIASQIDAGNIDINDGNHWEACTPFGGYKNSGMGREHGRYGFQELCRVKVIAK
ncbi:MAG: aldehyde dehydrogenase family protein [bacterium]